jgi:hypothetical protein
MLILVVKRQNYKKLTIKAISIVGLLVLLFAYYIHIGGVFKNIEEELQQTPISNEDEINKKEQKALTIESIIYDESTIAISLIGKENIKDIKIQNERLLLVTNPKVDLEALMIRYGVLALVQNTKNDIKIAVDLASIVQSRYTDDEE